mgnify:CR=1 FL=1|tara:strand:+ start:2248 stop:2871 length:624 start_codon:yes stop_codon:yes gene_type:complete
MAIKISVGNKSEEQPVKKSLLINIGSSEDQPEDPPPQASINLIARRALDGSIIISDHPMIDVVIQPKNSKVVSFTKEDYSDDAYYAQSRLFDYLKKKGVVEIDSVRGGNVYGSLEAKYSESEDRSSFEAVMFSVGKWVNQEQANELSMQSYEQEVEDLLTSPEEEDSTELGEIPHPDPNTPYSVWGSKSGRMRGLSQHLSEHRGEDG